jgi:ribokinase
MTAPAFDVIVCGSLHLDIMVYAPSLPRLDETVAGTRWDQQCGGKGGNQAVMSARAGARTSMIGRIGADDFGTRLIANLRAARVDASAVLVDPTQGSGMSAAVVRDDGDYGAVIVSGANLHIPPDSLERQWRELGGARVLILQNEVPETVNVAAAKVAQMSGAIVILNAAPARATLPELLDRVDVLIVNRVEAEMYSGEKVVDREGALNALPKLAKAARGVVVTLGGDGLVVRRANEKPRWIAPKPVRVVSSHGAGDCFVGTLAAKMAAGDGLLDAAEAANVAAANFVGRIEADRAAPT